MSRKTGGIFVFLRIEQRYCLKMAVSLCFTGKHLIFVQKQRLTKNEESCNIDKDYVQVAASGANSNHFSNCRNEESDSNRHDTFCDSFFYATGMPCCKWRRDINKWEEAILIRRKMHEL